MIPLLYQYIEYTTPHHSNQLLIMGRSRSKRKGTVLDVSSMIKGPIAKRKETVKNTDIYSQLNFTREAAICLTVVNKAWEAEEKMILQEIAHLSDEAAAVDAAAAAATAEADAMEPSYMLTHDENKAYNDQDNWFVECDVCRYNVSPATNEPKEEKCTCRSYIANIQIVASQMDGSVPQLVNVPIEYLV